MPGPDRVLIVGGGPVGAVTGLALARAGIAVTVFERLEKPAEDHRAATLQPATLDLFEPLGLTPTIIARGMKSPVFQWRDRVSGQVVAEFDYRYLGDATAYPFVIQLEQHKTVQIALAEAARWPKFQLVRPVDVIAVRHSADAVEADVRYPDGRIETHHGRYLVGCDGGRSLVRKTIDVSFDGFTYEERFNIVTTDRDMTALGYQLRSYCAHPDRWVAILKVPGDDDRGLWRCVFPAKPEESDDEVMGDAWIQARFAECLPEGAPYRVLHRNMYNVHQRVAGAFRVGRCLLAGDAAHVNNPIGGMGMNSGFQDGLNLADKLVAIWAGADPDPLLDRYDRQRRLTAIEYVQAQSIANKRTLEEHEPAARAGALDQLRRTAQDATAHRDFVMRSSLVAMLHRAAEIT